MRILFITQYFPPETGAPQNRISDLALRLSKSGHSVTILTAFPNYPEGRVAGAYRRRLRMIDLWCGLRVVRTWIYATPSKGFIPRLCNYFSFVLSSMILGARAAGGQDVLIVESPPLFLGLAGLVISRIKRARLVFNVSDLWPESAVALGVIRNRALIRFAGRLERFIYEHSDLISGQTRGIISSIGARVSQRPLYLLTNGVAAERFPTAADRFRKDVLLRLEPALRDKLIVGYAGLHGLAQGLETVLEAARLLRDRDHIAFVLIGDGVEKPRLKEMAGNLDLTNVFFLDSQPRERMPGILAGFDAALIPLKRLDLFKGALPSKMFEAMAAGLPLLVMIDGEARALMETAEAGVYVEPGNPQALAQAVTALAADPDRGRQLGGNGRRFVRRHFDRAIIARRFEHALLTLCCADRDIEETPIEVEP
ncbi:MAG TPA: glycosyltransferase family 4 protein [Terriglobia bacterium]|nr:glycosyltransferase family 4 protein [Terriglobia bacterium]